MDKGFAEAGNIFYFETLNFFLIIPAFRHIDPAWTLFIDRDGVVNEEKKDDYIHHWDEFIFHTGVKEAFKIFNKLFGHIIMITNQRGIARGLTRRGDVEEIHKNMTREIEDAGGRIDRIYFCPDLEGPFRKPNPGMGLQAIKDFPEIDLRKSIMIGNSQSDMEFGRNLGVKQNIFLHTTGKEVSGREKLIDMEFSDLLEVARAMLHSREQAK